MRTGARGWRAGWRSVLAGLGRPQVTVGRAKILFGLRVGGGGVGARRGQLGHAFVDPALLEARFHFDRHVRVVLGGFRLQAVAGGARHGECGGENEQGKSCGHAVSEDRQCAIRVPYGEPIFLFSLSGKTV